MMKVSKNREDFFKKLIVKATLQNIYLNVDFSKREHSTTSLSSLDKLNMLLLLPFLYVYCYECSLELTC